MKTRQGFVSNSSSSSFIIKLSDITEQQHIDILNYLDNPTPNKKGWQDCKWHYKYDGEFLKGDTCMNNGVFEEWLKKNKLSDKVEVEESY